MKTRINPKTGREEFWNQPEGLPGIWMIWSSIFVITPLFNRLKNCVW